MPLVVMVGHPSSGKTTRAQQLQQHFTKLGHEVTVINHESLALPRAASYASNESEKKLRATFKSTVERFLNAKRIVIFDYLNYIKGFRYEMWCRAREAQTQHCTVFCDTPLETCKEWNSKRPEEERYEEKLFIDLCQRMERPNSDKRWDNPLFTITEPTADLPLDDITNTLLHGSVASMNQAVVPAKMEDSNYLYELDRVTQDIVRAIVSHQASDSSIVMVGDKLSVPHATNTLQLTRKVHLPELRRIQAQYLKMARLRTPDTAQGIANTFVDHLSMCISTMQQG